MSLAILFHFLCAQHVSDINISIIRNLRLFCWITTLVVLFLVRCVLEFWCGWVGVVSVLQVLIYPSSGACDYSVELPHWSYCSWFDVCWSVGVVGLEWYLCCRLLIYPSSGACDYSVELPQWSYCSWFDVCWSFGVVGLEWYLCCRLLIYPSSGACDYSVELPHWSYCSWFDVCNVDQYDQCGNSTE